MRKKGNAEKRVQNEREGGGEKKKKNAFKMREKEEAEKRVAASNGALLVGFGTGL